MKMLERYGPSAARTLLAAIFVVMGLAKVSAPTATAELLATKGLPMPLALAYAAGVLEVVAGFLILFGSFARWSALALTGYLVPVTAIFHNPAGLTGLEAQVATTNLMKNLAIIGGLLAVAVGVPRCPAPASQPSGGLGTDHRARKLPVVRLALYYAALWAMLGVLRTRCTAPAGDPGALCPASPGLATLTTMSMATALALMAPLAWLYSLIKEESTGYDPAVLETLMILPVAVAGLMVMVQNSLPVAFSLAGIVAAVRFRGVLREPREAVFVFVAIGIGFAAGSQALMMAAVISPAFLIAVLVLWRTGFRGVYAGTEGRARTAMGTPPSAGPAAAAALHEATEPAWWHPVADGRENDKKGPRALLVVRSARHRPAWRAIERVLDRHTRRWKLLTGSPGDDGSVLEYRVRLKRKAVPDELLADVRQEGGPDVLGVELTWLGGGLK